MLPRLLLLLVVISCVVVVVATSKEEQKAFDALVKAVRKAGGYVHPSVGVLAPAPCGAPRGLGVVVKDASKIDNNDVLLKVPYSYQMTRELALSTLKEHIPPSVLIKAPLEELDDAALLVLLLAHEYGLGKKSKFHAYINSLPSSGGGCGWGDDVEDARTLPPGVDLQDVDVALQYAHRVSNGMAGDYGEYLVVAKNNEWPKEWKAEPALALRWALCVVSSRATAATGDSTTGTGVRLVPLADMANHFKSSGGFTELSGKERVAKGDFMDTTQEYARDFLVRSTWKCGTSRELVQGEEITVNYNLPDYGPVDWFLSLGFVPPEVYLGHVAASEKKHHVEL